MRENEERLDLWRYGTAGVEFIVTFGLLLGAGLVVDRWAGSTPIFTLLGAMAGFGGGLMRLVRTAREIQRAGRTRDDSSGPSGSRAADPAEEDGPDGCE